MLAMLAIGTSATAASKDFRNLTSNEAEVVREICGDTLKKFFNEDIVAWQETTYHIMPDDDGEPSGSLETLIPPVKVLSVLGYGFYSKKSIVEAALKEQVSSRIGSVGGKRYQILDASVFVEYGGGGGTMGNPIDKVTIFPRRIRIE